MFKHVLVGVDGRSGGRDAIALATRLIDTDGRLTFIHVHTGELRPSHAITPGLEKQEREASERLLQTARATAKVDAELLSIASISPARGLHEQAEKHRAALLVVGSCSHGAFGRAMLGDDARAALNGAPCAVAIASHGYAEHSRPLGKIGVGYDASPESEAALAIARILATPNNSAVHALEVVSMPTYAYSGLVAPAIGESIDVMVKEAEGRMQELAGVEGRVVYGLAGEELATFSAELDLLVVGSRDYGPMRRLVLGSTSHYLERHARCSLLALPRTGSESLHRDRPAAEAAVPAVA